MSASPPPTISEVALPPLPPASLDREDVASLVAHPALARRTVSVADLLSGSQAGVITSACRVPRRGVEGLVERALGVGDRRDVVLEASQPLGRLPAGTGVRAPDARTLALLRAHHPQLEPAGATGQDAESISREGAGPVIPEIRPLWPDPGIESAGELLEPGSWLPSPGQGVAVLLHAPAAADRFADIPEDPQAEAIVRAERAVGEAFSFAVPLVRAQFFGEWFSVHAIVLTPEGDRAVRARIRGDRDDPVGVAGRVIDLLMERGGSLLRPSHRS